MEGLGYAAALLLAVVFARAGVTKLGDRGGTARSFAALGLPPGAAVAVPVVELVLALALLLIPGWAAAGALALLAAFSTFLVRAVRAGVRAPCNCFGSARHAPVSWVELARNGILAIAATVALTADGPTVPDPAAIALVAGAAALAVVALHRAEQGVAA
jgi:uncharacterized membrane protein YphA (DoxX/SURF4 family)